MSVTLTNNEEELYKLFKRYHEDFIIMLRDGVFDFKRGHVIIRRDKHGVIAQIERTVVGYQAEK